MFVCVLKGDENDGMDEDDDEDGERMINEFVTQQLQGFTWMRKL